MGEGRRQRAAARDRDEKQSSARRTSAARRAPARRLAPPRAARTEKEVVGVGAVAAYLEQLDQVVKLAVDVAADLRAQAGKWGRARAERRGRRRARRAAARRVQHGASIALAARRGRARTVTGASTRCTLDSSTSSSRALAHSALTSLSFRYSHRFSASICRSRSDTPPTSPPCDAMAAGGRASARAPAAACRGREQAGWRRPGRRKTREQGSSNARAPREKKAATRAW